MLVSECLDRVFSEWLAPSGVDRPAYDLLVTDMDASLPGPGDTFDVQGHIVGAIPPDSLLEIDSELITTRNVAAQTVTVQDRGYQDSGADFHLAGTKVYLNPKYTRLALLHALASVIGQLYPWGLYVRGVVETFASTREVVSLPAGGKTILNILVNVGGSLERYHELRMRGRDWKEYTMFTPTRYIILRGAGTNMPTVVSYKKDFTPPTSESDDLTTLGIPETLQPYLPLAVAGYLLQSKELPRVQIEEIRRMLATTGIQVGQAMNIGEQMLNKFRQSYVSAERRRLREDDPTMLEWASA